MEKPLVFTDRIKSFKYAFIGIKIMIRSQHNAWIHAIATIFIVLLGAYLTLTGIEWCMLVLAIMSVWISEALNTAFEFLADVVSPEYNTLVKHSKDVAAGSVLISAMGSVIIGLIIFVPKMLMLLEI